MGQESYRFPTPTGTSSNTKNVKLIDSTPVTSVINKIIDGVLDFFSGEFSILDFAGRVSAVLFESIIYDFKEDVDIDPADWQRVQDNIDYNENRGYTNIKVTFLGLVEGYHTWKLSGYSSRGNYLVWHIQGYTKYQFSQAMIEETIDEVLIAINRLDWFEFSLDPVGDSSISRLELTRRIKAKAEEHGLL